MYLRTFVLFLAVLLLASDLQARAPLSEDSIAGATCTTWDATPQVLIPEPTGSFASHRFAPPLVDSAGNVTVVYTIEVGTTVTIESVESVGSSGSWGAPEFIAQFTNTFQFDMDAVIDVDDEITVVWVYPDSPSGLAARFNSRRRVDGVWATAQTAYATQSSDVTQLALGVDADGDVLLCFNSIPGFFNGTTEGFGSPDIQYVVYEKDTSSWVYSGFLASTSIPPSPGFGNGTASRVSLVTTPGTGELTIGFLLMGNGVYVRSWDAVSNSFGSYQFVPDTLNCRQQVLVAGGDGELTLFWESEIQPSVFVQFASRTVGGVWTTQRTIAPQTPSPQGTIWGASSSSFTERSFPPVANEEGDVLCAFPFDDNGTSTLRVAEYDAATGWKSEVDLGQVADSAVGRNLTAAAAWLEGDRAFVCFVGPRYDLRSFESNGLCWSGRSDPVGGEFFSRLTGLATSGSDIVLVYDRQTQIPQPFQGLSSSVAIEATWHRGSQGVVPLGIGGLVGVAGIPRLSASCELEASQTFKLNLTRAAPSSPTRTFIGFSFLNAPFLNGTLVPSPDVSFSRQTDSNGTFNVQFSTPADLPVGTSLWVQSWILDPASASGVSASNAVCALSQ